MTLLYIALAVFLVTAVFSMADMSVRMETARLVTKHGSQSFQDMIDSSAEAFAYALTGCVVGCAGGLLISKWLYDNLITIHFSYSIWTVPVVPLMVILVFVLVTVIVAVHAPAKRIRNMAVIETINEL